MMYRVLRTITTFLFIFFTVSVFAQKVSFEASSDAKQVVLGGYFEVSFTLNNANANDFQPPSFKDFQVLSGPSMINSTTSYNGNWKKSISYSYTLQPKKIGKFTIGSATASLQNKKMTTQPLTIEVVKGRNNTASTQAELEKQIQSQVYLKASVSSDIAYIGQQVVVEYKIYTSKEVENYNIVGQSDFKDFHVKELNTRTGLEKEVIDGVQYITKVIHKLALFPHQLGKVEIEPLELQVALLAENQPRRRSIFDRPKVRRVRIASEPLKIDVRALPSNAPSSFSGAIGKYVMKAEVPSRQISTNDAFELQLVVQGDGDLKLVQAPSLMLGDSFEVFDTKVLKEESVIGNNGRIIGQKVFDYLIMPKHAGLFKLQPQFTYYDTDSMAYVTLKNNPLGIVVKQGDLSKSNIEKIEDPAIELAGLKTATSLVATNRKPLFGSYLFFGLLGFPLLILGGAYIYKQRQDKRNNIDAETLKRDRANKVALKRLGTAKQFLGEKKSREFYDEISRAMLGYVSDKLNIPFSKMSKNTVKAQLETLKVSEVPIQKFMHVIKTSEMALFGGKSNAEAMGEIYQQAVDVVSGIEAELN